MKDLLREYRERQALESNGDVKETDENQNGEELVQLAITANVPLCGDIKIEFVRPSYLSLSLSLFLSTTF